MAKDYRNPKALTLTECFTLLNIAISTSKIHSLKTPYAEIRPSMHSILVGQVGSLKSSILHLICDQFKTTPIFNLSSAVLLGSVDKNTGIPILPAIWECRDSILPIDELNIDSQNYSQRSALHTFLSVLERPKFNKKIAYRVNNYSKRSNGLYCVIKDGSISVKTRFTLVANTMMNLFRRQRSVEMEALKSRCLLIPYYPTIDEIKSMLNGQNIYKFKAYNVAKNVKISPKTYEKLLNFMDDFDIKIEYYARTLGDLCRAYSVVGIDDEIFKMICNLRSFTTT